MNLQELLTRQTVECRKKRFFLVIDGRKGNLANDIDFFYKFAESMGRQFSNEILSSVPEFAWPELLAQMRISARTSLPRDNESWATLTIVLPQKARKPDMSELLKAFKRGLLDNTNKRNGDKK